MSTIIASHNTDDIVQHMIKNMESCELVTFITNHLFSWEETRGVVNKINKEKKENNNFLSVHSYEEGGNSKLDVMWEHLILRTLHRVH